MKCKQLLIVLGLMASSVNAFAQANPEKIKLVKAGKISRARVDWWGWNENNSTQTLQAAINSGARQVIIPNMGKPWIAGPIKLAGNQEIVLEPGAVIEALKGAFKGKKDCLFTAVNQKNIIIRGGKDSVIRMHKKDYQDKTQYKAAEWRHIISLRSCENIIITNLTLRSSGGDGIYIGSQKRVPCKNIIVRNSLIDDQHRQGISVIDVEKLLIENCTIENTSGTPPEAGIDLEPNQDDQRLLDITIRNCVFKNNKGAAIEIHHFPKKGGTTLPISVTFENCTAINNRFTGGFGANPPLDKITAKMTNCVEIFNGERRVLNDFWKDYQNMQTLTPKQLDIIKKCKRVDISSLKLEPIDPSAIQKKEKRNRLYLRGKNFLVFYARNGEKITFSVDYKRDYKKRGLTLKLITPSGKISELGRFNGPAVKTFSITAAETGKYILDVDPNRGWFNVQSKRQMALLAFDRPLHLFRRGSLGTYYFYIPAGTKQFYVQASGEAGERISLSVFDDKKNLRGSGKSIGMIYSFPFEPENITQGAIWSIKVEKASRFPFEDFYIDLIGIPPIFARDKAVLLKPADD